MCPGLPRSLTAARRPHRSTNSSFRDVLEKLESDPVCQRLSLKSFLILPFQRITRLKLLLQVRPSARRPPLGPAAVCAGVRRGAQAPAARARPPPRGAWRFAASSLLPDVWTSSLAHSRSPLPVSPSLLSSGSCLPFVHRTF